MRLPLAILISLALAAGSAVWAQPSAEGQADQSSESPAPVYWGGRSFHENPSKVRQFVDELLDNGQRQPAREQSQERDSAEETSAK